MNLFQDGQKIGFSHTVIRRDPPGYRLRESIRMRLKAMGLVQDLALSTDARLFPDLSLASFEFSMDSGRFQFKAKGKVSKERLVVRITGSGGPQQVEIPVKRPLHLASVLHDAVIAGGMKPGETRTFQVLDIASPGRTPVSVHLVGKEEIVVQQRPRAASRVTLRYKGITQSAWISETGEVLREEGPLGLRLEKTDPQEAVSGIAPSPGRDLTRFASVPVDTPVRNPATRTRLLLEIEGVPTAGLDLHGGRQSFSGKVLVVEKERLDGLEENPGIPPAAARFLGPSPFIPSDQGAFIELAGKITKGKTHPLEKIQSLVAWIAKNIEKKPVASVPDALSVLKNRAGDCNEYAVLLAALARAAGIPARVEAGLVYLKGRFYYHAWNRVHVGRWVTVDALFNQIPADVTHIRLIADALQKPLDLVSVLGKIRIVILDEAGPPERKKAPP